MSRLTLDANGDPASATGTLSLAEDGVYEAYQDATSVRTYNLDWTAAVPTGESTSNVLFTASNGTLRMLITEGEALGTIRAIQIKDPTTSTGGCRVSWEIDFTDESKITGFFRVLGTSVT